MTDRHTDITEIVCGESPSIATEMNIIHNNVSDNNNCNIVEFELSHSLTESDSLSSPSISHPSLVRIVSGTPESKMIDIDLNDDDFAGSKNEQISMNMNHKYHQHQEYETSFSEPNCRYCYQQICRKSNASQCYCSGVLCEECLINEVKLTHSQRDGILQCTVCKKNYDVLTEFKWKCSTDCCAFFNFVIHCGLKQEQYLLNSLGGRIGFYLVIIGIATWIISTGLLFAFPPNGCPIELYYMVSVFDLVVGICTLWFCIKCRFLPPLLLSIFYFLRFLYIILGWIPSVNLFNIYFYHQLAYNHVSILTYFAAFSLIAAIFLNICWLIEVNDQFVKYKKKNQNLTMNGINETKINIYINDNENDEF